jgi:hypothetical protein
VTRLTAAGRLILGLLPLLVPMGLGAAELDARLKAFGVGAALPEHDLQRRQDGTPAYDLSADLRLMFREGAGAWRLEADHSTLFQAGDSFAIGRAPGNTLEQAPTDDGRRLFDLTWEIGDGDDYLAVHRFDRLSVAYRGGSWGFSVGRQAVSWGNGIVFQPLDLFSPFAPTTVDRDYKAGDDLVLVDWLLPGGGDVQLLGVARREDGEVTGDAASLAIKWRGFVGQGELEVLAGRHFVDRVVGAGLRWPLGGALLRTDLLATRLDAGGWEVSGLINLDYSLMWLDRNAYLFAEYFHNGFGVDELPDSILELPEPLVDRLVRGEVFNLMRDYLALGGDLEWHPLWRQSLTLIGNLHDGSVLAQSQVTFEPGDHQRLQAGVVLPLGQAGDEFGGIPVAGRDVTTGGAKQLYLRWVYYF